jgi:molybdopterin/thiamine biosynthesis adenylyltransferase/rhodanese-related sulfurtransferase
MRILSSSAQAGDRIADMGSLPAVAQPAADIDPVRLARYSRQAILPGFGVDAQRRLANARVLVVGAGGLGSTVIPALAAAGVGTIGIVDADVVEATNLARQTIHGDGDVGRSKTASAADSVGRLDPDTRVIPHEVWLDSANALGILTDYDVVIDGSDNFPTRYLVNDAAALLGIPLVWGAVHQYGGQAGVCWAAHGPQYRDLFPVPPAPGEVPSCAEAGVLPTVCGVIGSILATEAIKLVTGIGDPLLGRVTSYEALGGSFRELEYRRDPQGTPITGLIDYDAFCGISAATDTDTAAGEDAVAATELAEMLAGGASVTLLDVREPWEHRIASIAGSMLVPLGELEQSTELAAVGRGGTVIVYCHHGQRSERAVSQLRARGIEARSLAGGIDAWSRGIDTSLTRY